MTGVATPSGSARANAETETLGMRLRAARTAAGLSLTTLARTSGVGKGSISEIENDLRPPRLETLWNLATAIGVPLGYLVGPPEKEAVEGTAVAATFIGSWTHLGLHEVYRATVAMQRQVSDAHAPGVEETITVVDGAVDVGPLGESVILGIGQSARFPGDRPHQYMALGGPAEVLILIHYPPSR